MNPARRITKSSFGVEQYRSPTAHSVTVLPDSQPNPPMRGPLAPLPPTAGPIRTSDSERRGSDSKPTPSTRVGGGPRRCRFRSRRRDRLPRRALAVSDDGEASVTARGGHGADHAAGIVDGLLLRLGVDVGLPREGRRRVGDVIGAYGAGSPLVTGGEHAGAGPGARGSQVPGMATTYRLGGQGSADATGALTTGTTTAAASADNTATRRLARMKLPLFYLQQPIHHYRCSGIILSGRCVCPMHD